MLLGLLGCAAPSDSAPASGGLYATSPPSRAITAPHPFDSTDADTTDPWSDPSYWAESGPLLSLLTPGEFPQTPHWRVLMFTSTDGESWSEGTTIAHSFANLDLLIHDGTVLLTGVPQSMPSDAGSIYALTTTDLSIWGSHAWEVVGPEGVTDASLHHLADGTVRAVYDTPDQGLSVAERDGERFYESASALLEEEELIDPSACSWQGRDHLFATRPSSSLVAAAADDGVSYVTDQRFVWDGVQAPHCFADGDSLWLLAQAAGGFGIPHYRELQEDGEFGPPQSLLPGGSLPLNSCTTPVVDRLGETLVLFCAAWWE
jgi:hypothetical protein